MKKITMRLIALALLTMFSMGAAAKIDVQIAKDGKFDGGTIEVTDREELKDGGVKVTITVSPDSGYTIKKEAIEVYATYPPSGSRADTRDIEIASTLTLLYNGSEKEDVEDASKERDYTFIVPSGFGAWVKDAKFQLDGRKGGSEPTRSTPGYSGMYFIGSRDYVAANTTTNFYLCPTEGWYSYKSESPYYTNGDNMPFMTTYQCRNGEYDARKAVWVIEKAAPNSDYYYIKRALDGKYLTYNIQMGDGSDAGRMRLHLEDKPDGDNALFKIQYKSGDDPYYEIYTKNSGPESNRYFMNVTGPKGGATGNINELVGTSDRTDGPTGVTNRNVGGIIGLWTSTDRNGRWYLESALSIAPPTITNNYDGTFTVTADEGASVYYTTSNTDPTTDSYTGTGTTSVTVNQTESMKVIKAIAKAANDPFPTTVTTYELPVCERPVISVSGGNVSITCATEGATIHYTTDGSPATSSSTSYSEPFAKGSATTIRAIATKAGYVISSEAILLPPTEVTSSDDIIDMTGNYILSSNFTSIASIGTSESPFKGTIDGNLVTLSGLDHPLVGYAEGAIIKNVILDNVNISSGTNVGAICGEATGDTRIYNCGVLATNSTAVTDEDGYTSISSCSSTISGTNYVGGIVGLLGGSSRVINCFSYANVSGGSYVGGIVGYNNVSTTASNIRTMVMNCMFYGEVSGSSIAPIYNGSIITNVGQNTGVSNFNYFRLESSYIQNTSIIKVYNCALGAETRFLQRFEFFRHLLNSNRELAAWWATGSADNKDEMMKWVLLPTQIGTTTPYPILKKPGKYPSVVNIDAENAPTTTERNKGGKLGTLSVKIQDGSGAPTEASITTSSLTLNITDKDFEHFNFNYGKVQLPYYNEVGSNNYTGNRVVTGWKIVGIEGGTTGSYSTGADVTYANNGELTATPYNFADRKCTNKDLFSQSGRVFSQGAYWDVPEGVTKITIEPYWATAVYLADAYLDKVYSTDMKTAYDVTAVGGGRRYEDAASTFNNQKVYTSMSSAVTALNIGSGTVNDYAVVLVGNYHQYNGINNSNSYTVTSVDQDGDNEPDYSFMLRFDGRTAFHPVKYDFLNLIGLGMAQKSTGGTGSYNFGIIQPKGWFEVTNTALFRVTQFEYSPGSRSKQPIILQAGVMEQWVTQQQNAGDKVSYFHIGGNVWFKEFHRGSHQDNADRSTPHPPLSVTGGDYDKFYLTGLYQSQATTYDDNAECYITGGRFGEMAGAGMEGIGTSDGKGNITWIIDHADIKEFYGGGINYAKPVNGNVHTIISNSYVDLFCGGPKFGDMKSGRTVKTVATGCTFGNYFGAGYGGNSYNRYAPTNKSSVGNINWNSWVNGQYNQSYNETYGGVSTQIDYQFIPMSDNASNVARLWVEYVAFSLAACQDVTSTLTGCTVTGNFYGGGSLGEVKGDVTSTLTDCTVNGSVFGAGYSASLPDVEVMNTGGFPTEPYYYEDLGTYRTAVFPETKTYTWKQYKNDNKRIDTTNKILYTTANLDDLGTVKGKATLNIGGNTTVAGSVYGGGESSQATGDVEVNISGGTLSNDVFGGGKAGNVGGNVSVNINGGVITKDVYGGGALANTNDKNADQTSTYTTSVNLHNGTINGNVYGGGLGRLADPEHEITALSALVAGDVTVNLNETVADDKCIVNGNVFGCNNLMGTPSGKVTVHIYKTWSDAGWTDPNDLDEIDDTKHKYHLKAVYGGGNLAAYEPKNATSTDPTVKASAFAHVIIDGCDLTSIRTVYGGGNAASTPAARVDVNGTYEIEELFGGGNGKDDLPDGSANPGANVGFKNYSAVENEYDTREKRQQEFFVNNYTYGSGQAEVNMYGGLVHRIYGGSNTKGNVRIAAITMLDERSGCDFNVEQAYGGGKSAPMDGMAKLKMACVPGLKVAYGGAEEADIQNDVILNLTNGNFDRVFGGNNVRGTIHGRIFVNVEETGCHLITVGQIYGGGNQAPYIGPWKDPEDHSKGRYGPTINIKSFSSIGEIYGGGYGKTATVEGDTQVNINVCMGKDFGDTEDTEVERANDHTGEQKIRFSQFKRNDDESTGYFELNENGDRIVEDKTETVTLPKFVKGKIGAITNVYGGGNEAQVIGNTYVNIGTQSTVDFETGSGNAEPQTGVQVKGVDIRGNVYGGGNKADVTGKTNVVIGRKETPASPARASEPPSESQPVTP